MNKLEELYFRPSTGKIVDLYDNPVDVVTARVLYETGKLKWFNIAFQRLASFDFDINRTLEYYKENRC